MSLLRRIEKERRIDPANLDPLIGKKVELAKRLADKFGWQAQLAGQKDFDPAELPVLMRQAKEEAAKLVGEELKLSGPNRETAAEAVVDEIFGLGPIEPLMKDDAVTEVMVNGPYQVYIEKDGKLELTNKVFADDDHVIGFMKRIARAIGRQIDDKKPMVDARLPDGSRVNAIIFPLSLTGPTLTIRKFYRVPLMIADMVKICSVTPAMGTFLEKCVEGKVSIVVSGGTGSGKTTLLNALSSFIPGRERIITIEDAAELKLAQEHVISLETRQSSDLQGDGTVTVRDLVRNALRMRPDRIIVGECRGPEALDMMQAMNTGHEGSLTTIHSNSIRDTLSRIETMILMAGYDLPVRAIRHQIASAIHLIVHLSRMPDGSRKVVNIAEISGMEEDVVTLQNIYSYEQKGLDQHGKCVGQFKATGLRPKFWQKLAERGVEFPQEIFQ